MMHNHAGSFSNNYKPYQEFGKSKGGTDVQNDFKLTKILNVKKRLHFKSIPPDNCSNR